MAVRPRRPPAAGLREQQHRPHPRTRPSRPGLGPAGGRGPGHRVQPPHRPRGRDGRADPPAAAVAGAAAVLQLRLRGRDQRPESRPRLHRAHGHGQVRGRLPRHRRPRHGELPAAGRPGAGARRGSAPCGLHGGSLLGRPRGRGGPALQRPRRRRDPPRRARQPAGGRHRRSPVHGGRAGPARGGLPRAPAGSDPPGRGPACLRRDRQLPHGAGRGAGAPGRAPRPHLPRQGHRRRHPRSGLRGAGGGHGPLRSPPGGEDPPSRGRSTPTPSP